ncbi:MAG: 4Fe-4S binding protein [Nitrospirota bacterium]
MTNNKIHILRRISQILFILLIVFAPALDIFRFDVDTRSLIVFGNEWDLGLKEGFYSNHSFEDASHIAWQFFLKAILPWLGMLAVFPILGVITGRFFCGWFCPEGALFELFDFLTVKVLGRRGLFTKKANDPHGPSKQRALYAVFAVCCMILIPFLGGVALTGYFVNPETVWNQVINWEFSFGVKAGIIGVAIYMLLSSLIIRHVLCKYVCSGGLMLMMFGWASPASLRIEADEARLGYCTDCRNCEKACFMNIKPRGFASRENINCVNCGECIEACKKELGAEKGIFSFTGSYTCSLPEGRLKDKLSGNLLHIK